VHDPAHMLGTAGTWRRNVHIHRSVDARSVD
jgi:hypothetical protein